MKAFQIISIVALVIQPVYGSDAAEGAGTSPAVPKVLRSLEPKESRFVRLPGLVPPAAPSKPARLLVAPGWHPTGVPVLRPAPEVFPTWPVESLEDLQALLTVAEPETISTPPAEFQPIGPPPLPSDELLAADPLAEIPSLPQELRKPVYPAGFAQESAVYCQRQIGHWTLADARGVFGEPRRSRAALGDDSNENGRIYAFRDPTNRYRELELDFQKDTGMLRTVFVYPWNLTWQDCRKLWGTHVSATEGSKGRVFYSYVNRHLDVLVDHEGKVISLGLY